MRGNHVTWYEHRHVTRNETHLIRQMINVECIKGIRPKWKWMIGITEDMNRKAVNEALTANREE